MEEKRVKLRIYGMTCDDCRVTVEKGLKSLDGVKSAKVDFPAGYATVIIDPLMVSPEDLETIPVFTETRYRAQLRDVEDE